MVDKVIYRDAQGKFMPGSHANPDFEKPGWKRKPFIADIVKDSFSKEIEVLVDGNKTRMERREIMADLFGQMISTGEIKLPDRMVNGELVPGRTMRFSGDDWLKHAVKIMHWIEPPVTQVQVEGDVSGIIFDKAIDDSKSE